MLRLSLVLICLVMWSGIAKAEEYQPQKNPFGQPEELKKKKPPKKRTAQGTVEPVTVVPQLKLTATLISVIEPMVIVNDQLLSVGEEIEGMRLSLVDEGRAVFHFRGKAYEFTIEDQQDTQTH